MAFVKARGGDLYYEESGGGPSILLVPPSGATASTWGTLVDHLRRSGRVITYDRRGYGRSAGEVVTSAAAHTADAAALVETLDAPMRLAEVNRDGHHCTLGGPGHVLPATVEHVSQSAGGLQARSQPSRRLRGSLASSCATSRWGSGPACGRRAGARRSGLLWGAPRGRG